MATTIRKALIASFGDVSNLSVVETTISAPAKTEVQLEVIYSGFGGADIAMRLGRYPLQKAAPLTPGYNLVGRVLSNGPGAGKFAPGSIVAALTVYDAQSERINVAEKYLCPIPDKIVASDKLLQQATAMVLDWNTAYGMVHRAAKVQAGQRVFIHGVSGSVGYATQVLCQRLGATVFGTASERNHDALRKLGVHPFVYTEKKWMSAMNELGGADAVFDPLGFESWDESYSILSSHGTLVGYGGNKATLEGRDSGAQFPAIVKLLARNMNLCTCKRTRFFYVDRDSSHFAKELAVLFDLLARGEVEVPIKKIWGFSTEALREAHVSWGKSQGVGSVLVRVGTL